MRKLPTITVSAVAVGMLVFGYARAQQSSTPAQTTPPASSSQAPAAKSPTTPAKTGTATTAKKPAPAPLTLKTNKDKASYALGLNWGKSMHRDNVDLDPNIILRGLKDGLAGGKTLLTDEEAKAAMDAFQVEMQAKIQLSNKKEGETFLAANKTRDGVVALPSGLQYKILKEGTGPKPTATDTVVCDYRGTLLNNTEFDSSYKRGQHATFPVTGVIKGWTEALQLMPVGSKWQLFIPSDLAYGERGAPRVGIGPNATLVFEVELITIQAKAEAPSAAPAATPNPTAAPTPNPSSASAPAASSKPADSPAPAPKPNPNKNL
ncbi:MAG: FKBP-type peptidyl-prolyl cis-trans isomerase [Candidatus Acidiferrum sp.]